MILNVDELCCSCSTNENYILDIQDEIDRLEQQIEEYKKALKDIAGSNIWTNAQFDMQKIAVRALEKWK